MPGPVRNRIVRHARVRAGDLVPHESNPRRHPASQRRALQALYDEVGFARSLLAYELPDGRLKLIDGHLRRDIDPDMPVDVEVLDVSDDEARKLLLSIDPLALLAEHDRAALEALLEITHSASDELTNLWRSLGSAGAAAADGLGSVPADPAPPPTATGQYLILVECADESIQLGLLARFAREGLTCRALVS